VKGGKQKTKLQDAGISPKQWPKKKSGRKRLAYRTRQNNRRERDKPTEKSKGSTMGGNVHMALTANQRWDSNNNSNPIRLDK